MFHFGDRVKHIETNEIGIVVGYGNRIVNNKCLETIKVKIISPLNRKKTSIKDLNSQWLLCPAEDYRILYPNPFLLDFSVKPVEQYEFAKSA